jgi:hypothetical protein
MHVNCQKFVNQISTLSAGMQISIRKSVEYFAPNEPPVTTLFEALGDRIAEDFDSASAHVNQQIFLLIEDAMRSGDSHLVTAVATGLIEAIVTQAVRNDGLWARISPLLGEQSLSHANAWLASC